MRRSKLWRVATFVLVASAVVGLAVFAQGGAQGGAQEQQPGGRPPAPPPGGDRKSVV